MKRIVNVIALLSISVMMVGCGSDKPPFEAFFTSRNDVNITYQGQVYQLNRYLRTNDVPFEYSFEADGDLDIVVEGKAYEVDNPYDIDVKKKKKISFPKKSSSPKKYKKK